MADKEIAGLNRQTFHTNVFGNVSRHVVKYRSAGESALESVALMPLPPGMRVDSVELRVTDVAAAGDVVSIGHEKGAVSAAAAWLANASLAAAASFRSIAAPYTVEDTDRFLIATFPNAVAVAFEFVVIVDYVFTGND